MARWPRLYIHMHVRRHRKISALTTKNPKCSEYSWLQGAAESALKKCRQYYDLVKNHPAYYAAEVLQPMRKWVWIDNNFPNDEYKEHMVEEAKHDVQKLWENNYKDQNVPKKRTSFNNPAIKDNQSSIECSQNLNRFAQHRKITTIRHDLDDAYKYYIDCDIETETIGKDALQYWNTRIRSQPDLAHFALDMLAIPVTSAECERIFISAKLLITPSRNRLYPDIIEAY
jgi:hypothetical protein